MSAKVIHINPAAQRADSEYRGIVQNLCSQLRATANEIEGSLSLSHSDRARVCDRARFRLNSSSLTAGTLHVLAKEAAADEPLSGEDCPERLSGAIGRVLEKLADDGEGEPR